jgi:hypothetical protein
VCPPGLLEWWPGFAVCPPGLLEWWSGLVVCQPGLVEWWSGLPVRRSGLVEWPDERAVFAGAERLVVVGPLSALWAASGSAARPTTTHTRPTAIAPPPTRAGRISLLRPVMT